jgi:hypothetical protein
MGELIQKTGFGVIIYEYFNPADCNPPTPVGGGMRRHPRKVALSSASRDKFNLQILRHYACNI